MSALYAFCRQVDDAADEDSIPVDQRRRTLAAWRADISAACEGREPSMEVNRELAPTSTPIGCPSACLTS